MAEPFFSSSWRILGPNGRALQKEKGRLQHPTYDARSLERGARRAAEHESKSCCDTDEYCTGGPPGMCCAPSSNRRAAHRQPHAARRPTETREAHPARQCTHSWKPSHKTKTLNTGPIGLK